MDSERGEGERARRQTAVMRFLAQMREISGERELVQALIQAAAVWFDLDARAYRLAPGGKFVMDMWLPGADPTTCPQELDCAQFIADRNSVRVSSMADLEQLGWRSFQGEVLLLPIVRRCETPWLIVIAGTIPHEAEASLVVVCRMAGAALEHVGAEQAHEVQARLARRVAETKGHLTLVAQAIFEELLSAVGAARGRLVVRPSDTVRPITFAIVGGSTAKLPLPDLEHGGTDFAPDRIVVTTPLSGAGAAAIELRAFDRVPFTRGQALVAEAGAIVLGSWLSGMTAAIGSGVAEQAGEVRPRPALEDAINDEMERVRRLSLKGGVLVVSFAGGGSPGEGAVRLLIGAMREELRSSDLLGQLASGEIAVLLVRASADGVTGAAWRVRKRLETLVRERKIPPIVLGQALYAEAGAEPLSALVERARSGAAGTPPSG